MCWLQQSSQWWHYPTFLLVPLLLIASIECFAGYHAWRILLGLNGAVLGFIAGAIISVLPGNPVLLLVGALGGAMGGAALLAGVVAFGSVVFAFGTAASLTILICRLAGASPTCCMLAAVLAGMGGAFAAVAFRRPAIIVLAAIAGAQQLVSAGSAYWAPPDSVPLSDVVTPGDCALFFALAVGGAFIQFATSRRMEATPQSAPS